MIARSFNVGSSLGHSAFPFFRYILRNTGFFEESGPSLFNLAEVKETVFGSPCLVSGG